jgi:hypothetical protein
MPAASSTARSGTPVHCAIADQPSSHVCRVICVRDGMRFKSSREKLPGLATLPSTSSRHSAKPFLSKRSYASPASKSKPGCAESRGSVVPIAGVEEMSRTSYSRTSECFGSSRRWAL